MEVDAVKAHSSVNQFTAILTTHVVIENVMHCAIMTKHVIMVHVC